MQYLYDFFEIIMLWCYKVTHNYGVAIILFTFLSKIALLPISVWVHKNSIKMIQMQPEINEIKAEYFGDKDTIADEESKLYKKYKYNPLASMIPLIFQIIILMGLIHAIKAGINNPDLNMSFLGIDLSRVPSVEKGTFVISPLAAALSSWIFCLVQNHKNVLQSEQSLINKYGTMVFSVALSLYLGWFVPVGVALYWIFSNLFAIVQLYILNHVISPKKYIDYDALEKSRKKLDSMQSVGSGNRKRTSVEKKRERQDYKKFFKVVNKHLVFYSEGSGFYKYYQGIIEYLLEHTNLVIHYITSDPNDQIFKIAETNEKIRPYYIGEKKLITLMLKMDADVVCMTMPELDNYYIKRSYIRKDIEYIYIPHGMDSHNLMMRKAALDHFDTVFVVGEHQIEEIRKTEEAYNLPEKKVVEYGYCLFDEMVRGYEEFAKDYVSSETKKILIAPSWQKDNIVDLCLDKILDELKKESYEIIVRPHPQQVRHNRALFERLEEKYASYKNIVFQTDFSSNSTVWEADLLITDWSGIAFEYAYTTKRPVLFINTPMKIMNPEYTRIDTVPINIMLRDRIGMSINPDNISMINERIKQLINDTEVYKEKISDFVAKYVYNQGCSAEIGANYIFEAVKLKINERKAKEQ